MTNNKFPLVTIGIPTYNRASSFLEDAIKSAVEQTYENIEIIVSDNVSTDHTEEVVKGFSDSRIRYFKHIKNTGMKNNFNACVEKARGDYFLLLCDDDLIDSPDHILMFSLGKTNITFHDNDRLGQNFQFTHDVVSCGDMDASPPVTQIGIDPLVDQFIEIRLVRVCSVPGEQGTFIKGRPVRIAAHDPDR